MFPAIRQSPVGERLGTESGSECQSDCAPPPPMGRRRADSHMPILLGNYLLFSLHSMFCTARLFATWAPTIKNYPVVTLRFKLPRLVVSDLVLGCCPRDATTCSRGVQIAFHPVVKRNETLRLRHAGVKDARH